MTNPRPYYPALIREGLAQRVEKAQSHGWGAPDWKRKSTIGALEKACGSREGRLQALAYLFPDKWESADQATTKDLTPAEWYALSEWVKPFKDDLNGGKWSADPNLAVECHWILLAASIVYRGPMFHEMVNQPDPLPDPAPFFEETEIPEQKLVEWYNSRDRKKYLMACGHVSNSHDAAGHPCCVRHERVTPQTLLIVGPVDELPTEGIKEI